jgi:hypothetical protein
MTESSSYPEPQDLTNTRPETNRIGRSQTLDLGPNRF